jgi:hypothetical protein
MCVAHPLCVQCVISDMEFTDADTEEDRNLKLRMLEIYNKWVSLCTNCWHHFLPIGCV